MSIDYTPEQRAILSGAPGYCCEVSPPSPDEPSLRFMCDQPAGHEGDHRGFELPTAVIDEPVDDLHVEIAADMASRWDD